MTIAYRIVIGRTLSVAEKKQLKHSIHEVFDRIDLVFNNWNPASEISKINASKDPNPIPLSQELFDFLVQIDELVHMTEGRFDPTVGKLKTFWLSHLKHHRLPSQDSWTSCYAKVGWKNIQLDKQKKTLTKQYSDVNIDLCGAVKGYTVDLLVEICRQFCNDVYVEWGGEIKTIGQHPSGRTWKVVSTSSPMIFDLSEASIATSGSYHQTWCLNGETYTHIINPLTGKPLDTTSYPIFSVTVIHPDCMHADALATALMTFHRKQDAEAWAKQHNIEAYINDSDVS